jgi:hypothetical protein
MTSILGIVQDDDDGQLAVQKKKEQDKPKDLSITPMQYSELNNLYNSCSDDFKVKFDKWLVDNKYHNLAFLPNYEFDRIKSRLLTNSQENSVKYGEEAING